MILKVAISFRFLIYFIVCLIFSYLPMFRLQITLGHSASVRLIIILLLSIDFFYPG